MYVRVSTPNQVHTQTIEHQIQILTNFLQSKQESITPNTIFRDDGYSGATLKRPGLDRLRDHIRNREIDCLVVTAPDRLARNYVHQMVLLEEFERSGCQVEFCERPMSHDPHDQLVLQIRGAVAEYERTLITERMRRGRLMKLQAGTLLPWTNRLFGYQVDPDHPRDPLGVSRDPVEGAIVVDLFAQYLEAQSSLHALSRSLHARAIPSPTGNAWWGLATIRGILTNPTYVGTVYMGRMRYRAPTIRRSATHPIGAHHHDTVQITPREEWTAIAHVPPLISQEVFDRVQAKLALNQRFARRNNTSHFYLLRSLVSCGKCQRACIARTNTKYSYYWCSGKGKPLHTGTDIPCDARFIPAQQLDELVWADLCQLLTHPDLLTYALQRAHGGQWLPQELQARRETTRKALKSLEQQRNRLTDAYLQGIIPLAEFERRRRDIAGRESALQEMNTQLDGQAQQQTDLAQLGLTLTTFCQRVSQGLAQTTDDQKRQLIEILIDRVVVTVDHVEIRYVFPTDPSSEQIRFCHLRTDYFGDPDLVRACDRQPRSK